MPRIAVPLLTLVLAVGGCSGADETHTAGGPGARARAEVTAPTPPDPLAGRFREYVALGDSFTSGPLIAPQVQDGSGCGRSRANYPNLLAERLEVERFRDVSCSGASTRHLEQPQANLFGRNGPQLRAVRRSTDLVTVGIGGNDFGLFGRLVVGCARLGADDPDGAPCRQAVGLGQVRPLVDDIAQRVASALQRVRARAPRARVVLVGYPRLVPPGAACPDVLPFAAGDYGFAAGVQRALDDALRRAAREAAVEYADVWSASVGHDACAGAQAWIAGRSTVAGKALSYHPNARGMAAIAETVYETLRAG